MDKQKDFEKGWEDYKTKRKQQTEEMIGIIQKSVGGCARNWASLIAEELIKYYQSKIPEGAVVLTRGEIDAYEERISSAYELGYKESKNRVVKETAEKFAERVKEETDHGISALYDSTVDKIAKEITEGE